MSPICPRARGLVFGQVGEPAALHFEKQVHRNLIIERPDTEHLQRAASTGRGEPTQEGGNRGSESPAAKEASARLSATTCICDNDTSS